MLGCHRFHVRRAQLACRANSEEPLATHPENFPGDLCLFYGSLEMRNRVAKRIPPLSHRRDGY